MSGSIKWTRYVSDDDEVWGLLRDESNIEDVALTDSEVDVGTGSTIKYSVPQNVRPRFATYKSTTTVRVRKITIPTRAMYDDLATGAGVLGNRTFTDGTETFALQSLTPERIRPIVFSQDTGLNDGDAT
jgi:hypothetical protein